MNEIITKRLKLRSYKVDDVDFVHEYASNKEIVKYMLFGPNTHEETENFVSKIINQYYKEEPVTHLEYAIELDGLMIGGVSIHIDYDLKQGEMGWILNPKFQKQGIVSEAAEALKQYAVSKFQLSRIIAKCDSINEASQGVMKKIGMHKIGIEKDTRIDKKTGLYKFDNLVYQIDF